MNLTTSLYPSELLDFLLAVAPIRPVFIWGQPGIGKSSLVEQFAREVGLECVSLVGTQLAPEDIIGVPKIVDEVTKFFPPSMISRKEPFCLFLDEINGARQDIQKAFYSLILDQRVGEYTLPKGSIVIGAGNREQDNAIVRVLPSALINRMVHVQLDVSSRDWLTWAYTKGINPLITKFIELRASYLVSLPPAEQIPFSTPRSWHMLSDAMSGYNEKTLNYKTLETLARGCLSAEHATQFLAFYKQQEYGQSLEKVLKGEAAWPRDPKERDMLYFLAQSYREFLLRQLPKSKDSATNNQKEIAYAAKRHLATLCEISIEVAKLVIYADGEQQMPSWFLSEIVRDLPRLLDSMAAK